MIAWCADPDPDAWARSWKSIWTSVGLAAGRNVCSALQYESDIGAHLPEAGGRLVLVVRVHVDTLTASDDSPPWLTAWARNGLVPEFEHECAPVPGDPDFPNWLQSADLPNVDGWCAAGAVLARRLTPSDVTGSTVYVHAGAVPLPGYFPLSHGERVPLPMPEGLYSVESVAAAFGVELSEVAILLDELVWSGVVRLGPRRAAEGLFLPHSAP